MEAKLAVISIKESKNIINKLGSGIGNTVDKVGSQIGKVGSAVGGGFSQIGATVTDKFDKVTDKVSDTFSAVTDNLKILNKKPVSSSPSSYSSLGREGGQSRQSVAQIDR